MANQLSDIQEMLKNNPGYLHQFTKFHLEQNVSFQQLQKLFEDLQTNKHQLKELPWPSSSFDSFYELQTWMKILNHNRIYRQFANLFHKSLKNQIKHYLLEWPAAMGINSRYTQDVFWFMKLEKHNQREFLKRSSRITDMMWLFDSLRNFRMNFLRAGSFEEVAEFLNNIPDIEYVIKDQELQLIIIICRDYEQMTLIGSSAWCITDNYSAYYSHVRPKDRQYVIFDFAYRASNHPNRRIGVTFDQFNRVKYCHDNNNNRLDFQDYVSLRPRFEMKWFHAPSKGNIFDWISTTFKRIFQLY